MAASTRRPGMTDAKTYSKIFSMERQSEEATRDAMHALAADTGGFLVQNTNDLHAGLKRMLDDTETYYVLAYEPTNTKRDGAFRRIEVRLPGQRDVKVRARAGYFAPGDRRASSPSRTSKKPKDRPSESGEAPLPAIPVHLSADFVSVDRGVSEVVVSGHVDTTTLPFVRHGDRYKTALEMVAAVRDQTGAVVTTLEPQRSALDMTEAQHERLSKEGIPYQKTVALPPGPIRRAPHGARGRRWGGGDRIAAGGDPGPHRRPADAQQPLPPEGGRGARLGLARLVLSQAAATSGGTRPCTCSSMPTTRSAMPRERRAWSRRRGSCEGARSLATGCAGADDGGRSRGAARSTHQPDRSSARSSPESTSSQVTVIDQNAGEKATRRVGFTID